MRIYDDIPNMLRNSTDRQCYGAKSQPYIQFRPHFEIGDKYCAVGTILHHIGYNKLGWRDKSQIREGIKKYTSIIVLCPICKMKNNAWRNIIHLNDTHRLSFSEIADKLEVTPIYEITASR